MSKQIVEVGNVTVHQFFAGVDKGLSLRIVVKEEAVMPWDEPITIAGAELTREQVVELAFELENWLKDSQDEFPPMGWTQEA
jgi:hypothetical protein